jgi:hypothetical protein
MPVVGAAANLRVQAEAVDVGAQGMPVQRLPRRRDARPRATQPSPAEAASRACKASGRTEASKSAKLPAV